METKGKITLLPQIKWHFYEGDAVIFDLEFNRYLVIPPEVIDVLEAIKKFDGDFKSVLNEFQGVEADVQSYIQYLIEHKWIICFNTNSLDIIECLHLSQLERLKVEQLILGGENQFNISKIKPIASLFRQKYACKSVCVENINSTLYQDNLVQLISLLHDLDFHYISLSGEISAISKLLEHLPSNICKDICIEIDIKKSQNIDLPKGNEVVDVSSCSEFYKRCDWQTYNYLKNYSPALRFIKVSNDIVYAGKKINSRTALGQFECLSELNILLEQRIKKPLLQSSRSKCLYGPFCMGH